MEGKFFNRYFECLSCHGKYPMKDMAYRWYYVEGPKGICGKCNAQFIKSGVDDVDKLLQTKYKDFPEDHNLYFRVWNYMWSKEVIEGFWLENYTILNQDEPDINYALCLIWEDKLLFRNWGAEVGIYLQEKKESIRQDLIKRQLEMLAVYNLYKNL